MAGKASPAPEGTIYTCPMHPEIRQDHPGPCPICGMALEPLMPTLEEGNPELDDKAVAARAYALIWMTEATLTEHVAHPTIDDAALVGLFAANAAMIDSAKVSTRPFPPGLSTPPSGTAVVR